MPTTLTDSSSFDAMTAPIGSDIRNAASVRTCLQAAANRDRFVYDMVQPLADIAALKAIASPPNGVVRTVATTGAYVFVAAYVGGEVLPWVVAPTSGSGKWVHVMYSTLGVDGGVSVQRPPLDDIAALKALANPSDNDVRLVKSKGSYVFYAGNSTPERVPRVVQPTVGTGRWFLAQDASAWRMVSAGDTNYESGFMSNGTWDIACLLVVSGATVYNRLLIDAQVEIEAQTDNTHVQLVASGPGGDVDLGPEYSLTSAIRYFTRHVEYNIPSPGNYNVYLNVKKDTGADASYFKDAHIRVVKMESI